MKRSILTTFFLTVFGGLFAVYGWAAPTISSVGGTFSHNQSVTISGSGFGNKSSAAPFLWDAVDNIAAYNQISNGQAIPTGSGYPWVANYQYVMSLTEGRAGSKSYKGVNTIKGKFDGRPLSGSPSHLYVSWWWKPNANPNLPSEQHSSKFLRLSNSADAVNKTFSWTQMQSIVYENPNYLANNWAGYPGKVSEWNFHEVWFDNVGRLYNIRVNGQWVAQNVSWAGGSGFNMNQVWGIGWDGGGANPPAMTTWMDNIYYDNTLSRVMIGNASTYMGSSQLEMQIPSTWSNSGINIQVNTGAFSTNQKAYLYVVDATGAVNSTGYPITIGASSGSGTPTTPPAGSAPPVPALNPPVVK